MKFIIAYVASSDRAQGRRFEMKVHGLDKRTTGHRQTIKQTRFIEKMGGTRP